MTVKRGGFVVLLLAAAGLCGQAQAQAVDAGAYHAKSVAAFDQCRALLLREVDERAQGYVPDPKEKNAVPDCINAAKAEAAAAHAALQKAPGKAPAKQAARALHAAVLTALDGVTPAPGERRGEYVQRQAGARARIGEAWGALQAAQ